MALSTAPTDAGLWPLVRGRVVTSAVVLVAAVATGHLGVPRGTTALAAARSAAQHQLVPSSVRRR